MGKRPRGWGSARRRMAKRAPALAVGVSGAGNAATPAVVVHSVPAAAAAATPAVAVHSVPAAMQVPLEVGDTELAREIRAYEDP